MGTSLTGNTTFESNTAGTTSTSLDISTVVIRAWAIAETSSFSVREIKTNSSDIIIS